MLKIISQIFALERRCEKENISDFSEKQHQESHLAFST